MDCAERMPLKCQRVCSLLGKLDMGQKKKKKHRSGGRRVSCQYKCSFNACFVRAKKQAALGLSKGKRCGKGQRWSKKQSKCVKVGKGRRYVSLMKPGMVLMRGDAVVSKNGRYRLKLGRKGVARLTRRGKVVPCKKAGNGKAGKGKKGKGKKGKKGAKRVCRGKRSQLWRSAKDARIHTLIMQKDGNLVGYTKALAPTFSTGTWRFRGAYLVVQSDGNMVVYKNSRWGVRKARWFTGTQERQAKALPPAAVPEFVPNALTPGQTMRPGQRLESPNKRFVLLMQQDGNLVLYQRGNGAQWATSTLGGLALGSFELRANGNLVGLNAQGRKVWASGTGTRNGASCQAVVQDDGNFVLYCNGRAVWARSWDSRWASGRSRFLKR